MTPIAFGAARRSATALSTPPLIATAIRPGAGAAANTGAIAFASASAARVSPGTAAASSSERPTSGRARPGASASTMTVVLHDQPHRGVVLAARGVADQFEPRHLMEASGMPDARDPTWLATTSRVALGDTEPHFSRITRLTQLRVAVLAPISWRVPPRHYGPWEQFASLLTEGLVAKGIDVTLFASGDSITSARLASVIDHGYSEDPSVEPKVVECLHIAHAFERADEFDVIHNSFDFLPLTYSGLVETPVITTIHGFSSNRILAAYLKYNATTDYIAISEADRHPQLDYLATIHHGIDTDAFSLGAGRATTCSSSAGSIPTRGPRKRSTLPPRQACHS